MTTNLILILFTPASVCGSACFHPGRLVQHQHVHETLQKVKLHQQPQVAFKNELRWFRHAAVFCKIGDFFVWMLNLYNMKMYCMTSSMSASGWADYSCSFPDQPKKSLHCSSPQRLWEMQWRAQWKVSLCKVEAHSLPFCGCREMTHPCFCLS